MLRTQRKGLCAPGARQARQHSFHKSEVLVDLLRTGTFSITVASTLAICTFVPALFPLPVERQIVERTPTRL